MSPHLKQTASLQQTLTELVGQISDLESGELIQQILMTLVRMSKGDLDYSDWKILKSTVQDMERGFQTFSSYHHVRKIAIFGSARIESSHLEYQMAIEFARRVVEQGFMVITGAGGGIMQAGNEGAGAAHSFGLNIQLPFEQGANSFIEGDPKLVDFKYFFTRKLFFVRESDALALFPGGFGTQDEAFECLTVRQTGKSVPVPLVLIDQPGGDYWQAWHQYIERHLGKNGLISPGDSSLYTITDSVDVACETIAHFYRVYHSSRYVGKQLVMRLKTELSDSAIEELNQDFADILVAGQIEKTLPLPQEALDSTISLPRIKLYFNQRDLGRLHQLILTINDLGADSPVTAHPELK